MEPEQDVVEVPETPQEVVEPATEPEAPQVDEEKEQLKRDLELSESKRKQLFERNEELKKRPKEDLSSKDVL